VAHPTGSEIRLRFTGRTAMAVTSGPLHNEAHDVARQLVGVIAQSIERPTLERAAV